MEGERSIPKRLSQKSARRLLEQHGPVETLGGKHVVKMVKEGADHPITLPMHKGAEYAVGLTNDILKQAGLRGSDPEKGADT